MSEPGFGAGPDVTWDKEEEIGTFWFKKQTCSVQVKHVIFIEFLRNSVA